MFSLADLVSAVVGGLGAMLGLHLVDSYVGDRWRGWFRRG